MAVDEVDIGLAKITLATADVSSMWQALKECVDFCSAPKTTEIPGLGEYKPARGLRPGPDPTRFDTRKG